MKTLLVVSLLTLLALSACDGAHDNPTGIRPPAPIGTDPAVVPPPAAGPASAPAACTDEARICSDGSIATRVAGSCTQKCPGE